MAVALTRFELICRLQARVGDRRQHEARRARRVRAEPGAPRTRPEPRRIVGLLLRPGSSDERSRSSLLASAAARIAKALEEGDIPAGSEAAFRWALRIMGLFPGDVGAIMPLILNHVVLQPGQASFIAPGELHAHLAGTCLEIMANSDNVIRGALTPKFVDLPELVSVLSFNPERLPPVIPSSVAPCEEAYPAFVPDFEISRIAVGPGNDTFAARAGPRYSSALPAPPS